MGIFLLNDGFGKFPHKNAVFPLQGNEKTQGINLGVLPLPFYNNKKII
jgi:hypothetical protein